MQTIKLIGSSPLAINYAYSCNFLNLNSIYAQTLRWKRKPLWLGTAKTKLFRVPKRQVYPEHEQREGKRLYNHYKTYLRSVRKYLEGLQALSEVQLDQAVLDKIEEEDYNKCFKINEEWNEKIAAQREVRLEQAREAQTLKILESIEAKKKRDELILAMVETKVREAKKIAPSFITRDNIDQAIDEALANVVDYNKALMLSGDWYDGKSDLSTANLKNKDKTQVSEMLS